MRTLIILLGFIALTALAQAKGKEKKQVLTLNGNTYWLEPASIIDTIEAGGEDKFFDFKINQKTPEMYGFTVIGYGKGFPLYALMPHEATSAAKGQQIIHVKISNRELKGDDTKPKTYTGYLPIHIYLGSDTGPDSVNCLRLPVTLVVLPTKG
jgi:hypothetical protein